MLYRAKLTRIRSTAGKLSLTPSSRSFGAKQISYICFGASLLIQSASQSTPGGTPSLKPATPLLSVHTRPMHHLWGPSKNKHMFDIIEPYEAIIIYCIIVYFFGYLMLLYLYVYIYYNRCFSKCNAALVSYGVSPIDWNT